MTDSEKLDLLLSEMQSIKNDTQELKEKVSAVENKVSDVENKVSDVENKVSDVEEKVSAVESRVSAIENRVSVIDNKVTDTNLILENEIRTNIKRIAEGHLDLSRNLHDALKIDSEKEMLAIRVSVLESELRRIKTQLDIA